MLQERELPQNIEAEQFVLGAMLIDKSSVDLLLESNISGEQRLIQ